MNEMEALASFTPIASGGRIIAGCGGDADDAPFSAHFRAAEIHHCLVERRFQMYAPCVDAGADGPCCLSATCCPLLEPCHTSEGCPENSEQLVAEAYAAAVKSEEDMVQRRG